MKDTSSRRINIDLQRAERITIQIGDEKVGKGSML